MLPVASEEAEEDSEEAEEDRPPELEEADKIEEAVKEAGHKMVKMGVAPDTRTTPHLTVVNCTGNLGRLLGDVETDIPARGETMNPQNHATTAIL